MSSFGKPVILTTRSGFLNVAVNGIPLHSTYDPVREAEKTASEIDREQTNLIIIVENGFGYLPLRICEMYPKTDKAVIIPEPRIIEQLSYNGSDFRQKLPSAVRIFSPFEENSFAAFLGNYPAEKIKLLIPPSLEKLFPETVARIRQMTAYHRRIGETNKATLIKYGTRFESNIRKNGIAFKRGNYHTIGELRDSARSRIVVIAGAGPTLDSHLNEIKEHRSRFLLLSVDTAAGLLLKRNITPDYIVTGDPQFFNAMHLFFVQASGLKLIAPFSTYYINPKKPWKGCYFYATRFPSEKKFAEENNIPLLGSGGTVAAAAVEAARFMGAKKIYLVGIDLGYPGWQTHAKGSFFEEKTLNTACRLSPFETVSYRLIHSPHETQTSDADGNRISSDRRMDIYRQWFAEYAKDCIRIDRRGSRIDSVPVRNHLF